MFTHRELGSFRATSPDTVLKLKQLKDKLGLQKIVLGRAVFRSRVEVVTEKTPAVIQGVDGLISPLKGQGIGLTFADCVPIYFASPTAVGIAHASWRNTLSGITENMLHEFARLGIAQGDIKIFIGPSICGKHFVVKNDVAPLFQKEYNGFVKDIGAGQFELNLKEINARILYTLGINKNNIEVSSECTHCSKEKYFSYRREFYGQKEFPVHTGIIGLKK